MPQPNEILHAAAKTQADKDAEYGAAWRKFGPQLKAMFPGGLTLKTDRDFGRFALFIQAMGKLGRYAANFSQGGHQDSIRDLAVYAAILESYDSDDQA
jgi:hypothetical protein